jgi:exosortase
MHAFALPVSRQGNVIFVPDGTLFVAEACSGITSIVTLMPVATFLGHFTQTRLWPRLALVAAVVPLAMLANLLRVVFTVLASLSMGPQRATASALHESAGALTYVFSCLGLVCVDWGIRRVVRARNPR